MKEKATEEKQNEISSAKCCFKPNGQIAKGQCVETRNSGFELLRILAMLMIISHHLAIFGLSSQGEGVAHYFTTFLNFGGKLGVDIFVLISAYFMCSKNFKIERILKIIFHTFFYSVLFLVIFDCIYKNVDGHDVVQDIFPVFCNRYWFVTCYVLLLFLSPLFNIILKNISQSTHKIILLFGAILMIALQRDYFYSDILWFCYLYFVASYIKIYGYKFTKIEWIFIGLFFGLGITFSRISNGVLCSQNSFETIFCALFLFWLFGKMKFKSDFVNTIASATFGVYLIHENRFIRTWLWELTTKPLNIQNSDLYVMYAFGIIMAVFVVCAIIDLIYQFCIQKYVNRGIDKICQKVRDKKYK